MTNLAIAHLWSIAIFGIATFIFFAISIDESCNNNKKAEDRYLTVSFVSAVLTILLMIFYMVGSVKCSNASWVYSDNPYSVETIVGLNDNNLTNGRFYMRRGYIEEKLYYQYMVRLSNGGFVANRIDSTNATIFYDTSNYRVEWYKKTRGWLYFKEEATYHKVYIPEGSITDDYSIDLN